MCDSLSTSDHQWRFQARMHSQKACEGLLVGLSGLTHLSRRCRAAACAGRPTAFGDIVVRPYLRVCVCVLGLQVDRCVCLTAKRRNAGQSGVAGTAALQRAFAIQAGNITALGHCILLCVLNLRPGASGRSADMLLARQQLYRSRGKRQNASTQPLTPLYDVLGPSSRCQPAPQPRRARCSRSCGPTASRDVLQTLCCRGTTENMAPPARDRMPCSWPLRPLRRSARHMAARPACGLARRAWLRRDHVDRCG